MDITRSPQLTFNSETCHYEAFCDDQSLDTFFVFSPDLKQGDKLVPLDLFVEGIAAPSQLTGSYNVKSKNLELEFVGTAGYRFVICISVESGSEEMYSWKSTQVGVESCKMFVPRSVCMNPSQFASAQEDVLGERSFLGSSIPQVFCSLRLQIVMLDQEIGPIHSQREPSGSEDLTKHMLDKENYKEGLPNCSLPESVTKEYRQESICEVGSGAAESNKTSYENVSTSGKVSSSSEVLDECSAHGSESETKKCNHYDQIQSRPQCQCVYTNLVASQSISPSRPRACSSEAKSEIPSSCECVYTQFTPEEGVAANLGKDCEILRHYECSFIRIERNECPDVTKSCEERHNLAVQPKKHDLMNGQSEERRVKEQKKWMESEERSCHQTAHRSYRRSLREGRVPEVGVRRCRKCHGHGTGSGLGWRMARKWILRELGLI